MNEVLRYEEAMKQQLAHLPLPDENFAWQEMKKLLEEDDDDPVIVPLLKRGCGPVALLLVLLLIGIAWWFLRPEKWFTSSETETVAANSPGEKQKSAVGDTIASDRSFIKENPGPGSSEQADKRKVSRSNRDTQPNPGTENEEINTINEEKKSYRPKPPLKEESLLKNTTPLKRLKGSKKTVIKQNSNPYPINEMTAGVTQNPDRKKTNDKRPNDERPPTSDRQIAIDSRKPPDNTNGKRTTSTSDSTAGAKTVGTGNDSLPASVTKKRPVKDSIINNTQPPAVSDSVKEKEKDTHSWSAGLALNQQLAFMGQTMTTYSSLGREASVKDYIPSVYIRYNKDKKWFVQAELRYGAPQYTKNVVYDIKTIGVPGSSYDSRLIVKKTYYHQLPLGFNYYLLPGFSFGAGVVWNRFSSAVSQQEEYVASAGQPDSILSTGVIRTRIRNKAFSKSFFQAMSEMQYSYKRFTLGARYAKGIQPYLKFQLPGEPLQRERNSSLQIFFRYKFWQSKKK